MAEPKPALCTMLRLPPLRARTHARTHAPARLPAVGIFADLDAAEREALAGELETRTLKRGDVLVRQGDAADALYIVLTGRFAVMIEGRREPITEIGPDQPIGEIAFLTGGKRTATVTAMRDSLVLRLGRAGVRAPVGQVPQHLAHAHLRALAAAGRNDGVGAACARTRARAPSRSSAPAARPCRRPSSPR